MRDTGLMANMKNQKGFTLNEMFIAIAFVVGADLTGVNK